MTRRAREDLAMLSFATKPWVIPAEHAGRRIPDVAIVGAGQSGLVLGHELKRRGVDNILLLDRAPEGREGVWDSFARNYEIRSPKEVMGADLNIPSLTIQSFFTACHGRAAWDALKRVPRTDWMAYLRWYRSIADLPVRNGAEVADIDFDAAGVSLSLAGGGTIRARHAVLATGMDGGGAWAVPEVIAAGLPPERYSHSSDGVDAAQFAGRDIAILGAGAAAFDMAVTALDAGARQVEMFMRRRDLPMKDVAREFETGGHLNHSHELSDLTKWNLARFMSGLSQSPAEHHFFRACSFPNFRILPGAPWETVGMDGGRIVIGTPRGRFEADHAIAATGTLVDMSRRPELARIARGAALWRDRFQPPADDPAPGRLLFPYLDRDYRFTERVPGAAPGIGRIVAFNALASLSMGGMSAVSISSHRFGVPRVADGLTRALFAEQEDRLIPMLEAHDREAFELPADIRAMLDRPG
nr:NAD(P)-binding domain-containing protein [Mangrovicoccus sp. HB161399]